MPVVAAGLFLAAFGLYLWCFQPAGSWGDGGDFVLCSYFLGVPHPTGYPMFALLGKAATFVPAGSAGIRVGLLASFCGALAVGLFFLAATRLINSAAAGFYAAAVLGATSFFWSQSITVEAYGLNLLFFSAMLLCILNEDDVRGAFAFFLVAALGLGNHGTLVVPAVILGIAQLVRIARRVCVVRMLLTVGFFVLLGLSIYLCLPMFSARSQVFNWNDPQFARNVPFLLSGYDFWVVGEYIPSEMWKNFGTLLGNIESQVSVVAAILFLVGLFTRPEPLRKRFVLFAVFFVAGAFPILYPTREKESFFLISYTIFLLFAAAGAWRLVLLAGRGAAFRYAGILVAAVACVHAAILLERNTDNYAQRVNDTPGRYSDALFLGARRDALVLIDHLADDTIYPPMYGQFIDGRRRDVFLFHRLYLAFPWYMDAMRERGALLGSGVDFPRINIEEERNKSYEVTPEEMERRVKGNTLNTISVDIQTARLLDANRKAVPIYINSPVMFKDSMLSAGYDFAPDGAMFRLDAREGAAPPGSLAGAEKSRDAVYRKVVKTIYTSRVSYHEREAVKYGNKNEGAFRAELEAVSQNLNAALLYGEDCALRGKLAYVYDLMGRARDAKREREKSNECLMK